MKGVYVCVYVQCEGRWESVEGFVLIVFRLLLLLDGPEPAQPEVHTDTDQPAIKQIKYNNTDRKHTHMHTHRQIQNRAMGHPDSQLQP